jgi:hypothetical protein
VELLQVAADNARVVDFYKTASGLSFTLLGLWWVVVQVRYKDAKASPQARRHAYGVLLFFLMPGMMSLFSIVDDAGTWWRVVFALTAGLGLLEIVLFMTSAGPNTTSAAKALRVVGFADYVAILLVCLNPKLPNELNLGLTGLQVEAILTGLLIVVGIHLVFLAITEDVATEA